MRKPASKLRLKSRFDHDDEDPRASLVNLVDVMLVFACGLLAALSAGGHVVLTQAQEVKQGREIAAPDIGSSTPGSGYEAVGQVYRDPRTGKMVLIEQSATPGAASNPAQPRPARP